MSNLRRCMHGGGGTVCCHWGPGGGVGSPQECKEQPRRKGLHPGRPGQLLLRRQDSSFTMLPDGSTAKSALSCSCSSTAESVGRACRVHMQILRVFSLKADRSINVHACHAISPRGRACSTAWRAAATAWGSTRASRRRGARPCPGTRVASSGSRHGGKRPGTASEGTVPPRARTVAGSAGT